MSDLSPETSQLLELARGAGALSDARRSQIKAAVFTQIAAGGLAVQVGASSLGFGKAAWFSGPVGKLVSALALASVAGAGVYAGTHSKARQAPAPQVAASAAIRDPQVEVAKSQPATTQPGAPVLAAPEAPVLAAPEAPAPAAPNVPVGARSSGLGRAAPASAPAATPSNVSADTLVEETRLLRAADQALRSGNAQRALALLDEHAARYPHGALAPERAAERMIARCQLGQRDAGNAQAYLTAHPDSAFTARIRDACGISR